MLASTELGLADDGEILPVQNLPAVLAFARFKRWIIEGPEGGHGLSPLGVKEIRRLILPEIPFDEVVKRAKDNCAKDGGKWEVETRGRDASKGTRSISENVKRTYISDAERQLKREKAHSFPMK